MMNLMTTQQFCSKGVQVSFVEAYYTVGEEEGVQRVCVELSGAIETSISVRVDTQPGSALGMPNIDLHMQLVFIIIDIVVPYSF